MAKVNFYQKYIFKIFCKKNKIKYVIGRFPNVVGKPFTHGVIFDLANKIKKIHF